MKSTPVNNRAVELQTIEDLMHAARSSKQRYLVVISGERDWTYRYIESLLQTHDKKDSLCISSRPFSASTTISYDKAEQYLGNECDHIVYDAFSGLFPSTLALSEGLLKGGALFFLLAPTFAQWPASADIFKQKYAMHPYAENDMCHHFISRLIRLIKLDKSVTIISQQGDSHFYQADVNTPTAAKATFSEHCQTLDQQKAVDHIIHTVTGHRNRPLVLLSNRGRGKSASLGIASALLMQEGAYHITVTGPRKKATQTVFKHIHHILGLTSHNQGSRIEYKQSLVEFIAPDELIRKPIETNLLLVDEAATLPLPLLESLLKHYHRVVFSSTVYGYEGNGRGFEIKFLSKLDKRTPGWKLHQLKEPIRWSHGDALEQFFFKAFLLDSDCHNDSEDESIEHSQLNCVELDKSQLVNNEPTLTSLFGLLTHAHYKTTPNDLRMIIDSPYVRIYSAMLDGQMVGAALVSTEGNIAEDFAIDIMNGNRRISGQFLPQTLISDYALTQFAQCRYARIMRIAVHPTLQRKGIGMTILRHLDNILRETYDFLGAGFGSDEGVFNFWKKAGYMPVKIGHKRNAFSGQHSLVVIKGLSSTSEAAIDYLRQQFPQHLLYLFTDSLKNLDSVLVQALLASFKPQTEWPLSNSEWRDLKSFAYENRHYNTCAHLIYKLILNSIHRHQEDLITDNNWAILTQRLIQRHDETTVINNCKLKGKSELLTILRESTAKLIEHVE